jgi:hypothetical protein
MQLFAQRESSINKISITVLDINHKPVPSAIISFLDADSSGILFSKTDDNGVAHITYDSTDFAEVKLLKVSAPGFDVYYAPFTYALVNYAVYMVAERMATLKEVTIKTKKRPRIKLTGELYPMPCGIFNTRAIVI